MKPTDRQDPGDYSLWTAIFKASRPRFIDNEDSSLIRCLDKSKANQLSIKDFQRLLRRQTIVLIDGSTERLEFDLKGLGDLAAVDDEMDIQGEPQRRRIAVLLFEHPSAFRPNDTCREWKLPVPGLHWDSQRRLPGCGFTYR